MGFVLKLAAVIGGGAWLVFALLEPAGRGLAALTGL